MPVTTAPPPPSSIFDDDEDGWQDMPVVRDDTLGTDLDEEDRKKYHYQPPSTKTTKTAANATGNLIDVDDRGNEWRSKLDQNESEYTRLRMKEEDDMDEVHLRTRYLFDEDKAMTPLSQMQATKKLLTDAQRIAYVGLCALTAREMAQALKSSNRKELKAAVGSMQLWSLKIMGRLFYHMELETQEQKMIENLAEHGVQAMDLVPSLMTTHTVANPEYDPEEARRRGKEADSRVLDYPDDDDDGISISDQTLVEQPIGPTTPKSPNETNKPPPTPTSANAFENANTTSNPTQTTAKVLGETTAHMPGVTTSLSSADENVTLDIRWTILCDLFLILIADSVYDARSRVLLENVAQKLGLGWLDVVKFESRVTEALEIQEDIEKLEQQEIVEGVQKAGKRRRYVMMGLATLGGGLVIGLSAGLLAPVIGAGLGAAFSAIGIGGTTAFLGGTAGAAAITTGGVLTGSAIAGRGMSNRTQEVRTFDILPLHNNKRVNCILTVPGFMNGVNDDVRLPFSVLDPIVGDVFSVLWEPEMIRETGSALKIMTAEVLSQLGMTVLGATSMFALMSALQWPIILTKLGYLIDNPWSNALDRAKSAGRVLADVLINRHLGVRPITLIGFSLGARVIFYALLELSKQKAYGIVQDVFLLGTTVTASQSVWCETRSVVSGRYVNAFAKNDWVLKYLFRATSGGVGTVAGLGPVRNVPGLENVDVTDKIAGHMSYRTFMPLILDQLGFPVSADFFNEPEEPEFDEDRVVIREEDKNKKKGWFSSSKKDNLHPSQNVSRPPTASHFPNLSTKAGRKPGDDDDDDDLPPRMPSPSPGTIEEKEKKSSDDLGSGTITPTNANADTRTSTSNSVEDEVKHIPKHAGFDLAAMKKIVGEVGKEELGVPPTTNTFGKQTDQSKSRSSSPSPGLSPRMTIGGSFTTRSASAPIPDDSEVKSRYGTVGLEEDFRKSVSVREETRGSSYSSSMNRTQTEPFPSSSFGYSETPVASTSTTFGGAFEAPVWGAPPSSKSPNNGYSNFGGRFESSRGGYQSSRVGYDLNPFGSPIGVGVEDTGLSFGTADGTITGTATADPWVVPSDYGAGKRSAGSSAGFGGNPWS